MSGFERADFPMTHAGAADHASSTAATSAIGYRQDVEITARGRIDAPGIAGRHILLQRKIALRPGASLMMSPACAGSATKTLSSNRRDSRRFMSFLLPRWRTVVTRRAPSASKSRTLIYARNEPRGAGAIGLIAHAEIQRNSVPRRSCARRAAGRQKREQRPTPEWNANAPPSGVTSKPR